MKLPRVRPIALSLFAACMPAAAQSSLPPMLLGTPDPASFHGLLLNQWYVAAKQVSAGSLIDGVPTQGGSFETFPLAPATPSRAESGQTLDGKTVSASALATATQLGASASAAAPLQPDATGMTAVGYAALSYWAVLDRDVVVSFSLGLQGSLSTSGSLAAGSDASTAGVAVLAHGSQANFSKASQAALFANAGLDVDAEGETLLRQLGMLQPSTQPHLDVFGAQADTLHSWVPVDTTMSVTAHGTELVCDGTEPAAIAAVCGRYFYFMNVFLFTGAHNGATADFSHTLGVSSIRVDGGPEQAFSPVSAVPEPGSAWMLSAGLGLLGLSALSGLAGRHRAGRPS